MHDRVRIFADFNNADEEGRLRLNVNGSQPDLARLAGTLRVGDRATFYCDELEADGTLERSGTDPEFWVGRIDWAKVRDRSVE